MVVEREWAAFKAAVSWFTHNRPQAAATKWEPAGTWQPSPDFERLLPRLTRLLRSATLTHVEAGPEQFVLYSWFRHGLHYGWLSPADHGVPAGIHPDHEVLLGSFRGIIEQYNSPDTWILSHNDVLTATLAGQDASFIEAYAWAFEETGGIPIELQRHYCMAQEANGNTTLCDRETGEVLLFAPDHAFDYVSVREGCPEFSLYNVTGAPRFPLWVEAVAEQWSDPPRLAV